MLEAGGFPLEFPVMSLGDDDAARPRCCSATSPPWTSRNRSARNPLDGVVLLMGCDKTTPALLMGAASADLPTSASPAGRSCAASTSGQIIGSGTNIISMSEQLRAGEITLRGVPRGRSRR